MEPRVTGGESHDAANGKLDTELRRGVLVLAVLSQLQIGRASCRERV